MVYPFPAHLSPARSTVYPFPVHLSLARSTVPPFPVHLSPARSTVYPFPVHSSPARSTAPPSPVHSSLVRYMVPRFLVRSPADSPPMYPLHHSSFLLPAVLPRAVPVLLRSSPPADNIHYILHNMHRYIRIHHHRAPPSSSRHSSPQPPVPDLSTQPSPHRCLHLVLSGHLTDPGKPPPHGMPPAPQCSPLLLP